MPGSGARQWPVSGPAAATLHAVSIEALPRAGEESFAAAFRAFRASALAIAMDLPPGRPAVPASAALKAVCARALTVRDDAGEAEARAFALAHFDAWRIEPLPPSPVAGAAPRGFVTGYYEPELDASHGQNISYTAPLLSRPGDLVTFVAGETPPRLDSRLAAARRLPDGRLAAYPTRAEIALARPPGCEPLAWLPDAVEVFLVQVQGSARLRFADGGAARLGYAGRNGHPYTSIGRKLIERGVISENAMSLAALKAWLRANGEAGVALMHENASYVFFRFEAGLDAALGPRAAAGVQLTPLRSIAIDRALWSYGLPFWLDARLPWQGAAATPFHRLMIAQDTGSAIVGPARADIFFGSGEAAGERAGDIRHPATLHVLLPREGDT